MINDNNETYGVIAGYKIFITLNHQPRIDLEVSSFENEVHLNDLLPNTSYGVIVFGHNHYGDGMISDMFNFTTKGIEMCFRLLHLLWQLIQCIELVSTQFSKTNDKSFIILGSVIIFGMIFLPGEFLYRFFSLGLASN